MIEIDISKASSNNCIGVIHKLPKLMYFITSVSLPSLTSNTTLIPFPRVNGLSVPSTTNDWEELTLVTLTDERLYNYLSIVEWINYNNSTAKLNQYYSDMSIIVLSNAKNPILRFDFIDCYPSTLSNIEFNFDDSTAFTFYATFRYHKYTYKYLDNGEPIDISGFMG